MVVCDLATTTSSAREHGGYSVSFYPLCSLYLFMYFYQLEALDIRLNKYLYFSPRVDLTAKPRGFRARPRNSPPKWLRRSARKLEFWRPCSSVSWLVVVRKVVSWRRCSWYFRLIRQSCGHLKVATKKFLECIVCQWFCVLVAKTQWTSYDVQRLAIGQYSFAIDFSIYAAWVCLTRRWSKDPQNSKCRNEYVEILEKLLDQTCCRNPEDDPWPH